MSPDPRDPWANTPPPGDDDFHRQTGEHSGAKPRFRIVGDTAIDALADGHRGTDTGNADRLVALLDGRARYVHSWSKWLVYSDGRWIIDPADALITELARGVPRAMFASAARLSDRDSRETLWKWAKRSEGSGTISAMVRLARGAPGILVDHNDLDSDPYLLNVLNGTVDLRTGLLREHDPDDLLTMQAPVMYDPDARAATWEACVERWQPDQAIREFLRRAAGSGCTGKPVERLIVSVGAGANGKSKFFGAISHVLGFGYAIVPDKSLLVTSAHEQHATVKASLFRSRFVVAPETTRGDNLNEEQIKSLTGGDVVRARRMREDEWSFMPTWTAFLHTNYRPDVRGTDEGIWRRLRLIPWDVTIPPIEQDPHLADRLALEAPGILNWLIEGARDYIRHGLAEPDAVLAATNAYRRDQDVIGRFIAECCILGPFSTPSAEMRRTYEAWSLIEGTEVLAPRALGIELQRLGYRSHKVGGVRVWQGFRVAPDAPGTTL